MLRIEVPYFALEEIAYTLRTLLNAIHSNIEIEIEPTSANVTTFYFSEKYFAIQNHFFQEGGNPETWYVHANIPHTVKHFKPSLADENLIVLFGETVEVKESNGITLQADLLSTAFFMLSRWEEFADKSKDIHGRFLAESAVSVTHKFIHIPIVNQIAFYLKNVLAWLGYDYEFNRQPEIIMTFDIDYLYKWKSVKNLAGAIVRNGLNFPKSYSDLLSYLRTRGDRSKDPYFSFDFILDSLNAHHQKAVFYFKSEVTKHKFDDADYDLNESNIQNELQKITKDGHEIGLHPSYASFKNAALLSKEKQQMEEAIYAHHLVKVRQHFLRIQYPETYRIFLSEGFKEDSSSMYTHHSGFRNGTASPFQVFDFLDRKVMDIYVVPLISMMSLSRSIKLEEVVIEMISLIEQVRKYRGKAMLLWHNSDLDTKNKRNALNAVLKAI